MLATSSQRGAGEQAGAGPACAGGAGGAATTGTARAGDRGPHAKSEATPPLDPMAAAKARGAHKSACSASNSLHPCVVQITALQVSGTSVGSRKIGIRWCEQRASHQQRTLLLLTNCSFDTNVLTCWAGGSGSLYPVWQLATGCKQVGDNGWGWVWSVGLSLLVMIIELVMRGLCFGGGACYCSSKLVDFLHSQGEERATVEYYRVVLVEGWVDTEVSRSSRF
jgi:hypothetical protein